MATPKKGPGIMVETTMNGIRDYKYTQEISQMVRMYFQARYRQCINTCQMFVFGEVQDPNPDAVNLVEDIVRSQLIELVSIHATSGLLVAAH